MNTLNLLLAPYKAIKEYQEKRAWDSLLELYNDAQAQKKYDAYCAGTVIAVKTKNDFKEGR